MIALELSLERKVNMKRKLVNYIMSKEKGIFARLAYKLRLHDKCYINQRIECWCW